MRFPRPVIFTDIEMIEGEDLHATSNLAFGWTGCERCSSAYANHLELIHICLKCKTALCPTCMGKGSTCPLCKEKK